MNLLHQCSHNGKLTPLSDVNISLLNIEYCYGFGVYESVRVNKGCAYFLEQHTARLLRSAQLLELDHEYTTESITGYILALIEALEADTYNLKMLLIGGKEPQLVILPMAPRFPDRKWYKHGVKVITYPYERQFPNVKSLNMLGSYLAYRKAMQGNAYDALLLHANGSIPEGTRTNIFARQGTTLITPPAGLVLEGVTRANVMSLATANGYQIVEENIYQAKLSDFDDIFITSTSSKIMPVNQVDELTLGAPSTELKDLMKLFDEYLEDFRTSHE